MSITESILSTDIMVATEMPAAPRLAKVGAYQVLAGLTSGGMGEVLLACARGRRRQLFAVKLVRTDLAHCPQVRDMFVDEGRLLSRIDHPGITRVVEAGVSDGASYLVMEYVEGVSLDELLAIVPVIPPLIAARMIAEICRALHAAHEATALNGERLDAVHRDVSPKNLMLTFDGSLKVLDFGIAYMRQRASRETQMGELKGKPSYMAPEQFRSEPVNRRTDVYSASVVLYELLTGRPLYAGDNLTAVALAVAKGSPPPPSSLAGPLPDGLDEVVLRGLDAHLDARISTAADLADRLDAIWRAGGSPALAEFAAESLSDRRLAHRAWLDAALRDRSRPPSLIGRLWRWLRPPAAAVGARPAPKPTPVPTRTEPELLPKVQAFTSPIVDEIVETVDRLTEELMHEPGGRMLLSIVRRAVKNDGIALPNLPEGMLRLERAVARADADLGELVAAIQTDPSVAARFLGVANSPFYGAARRVTAVHDAVVRIGMNQAALVTMAILSQSKVFAAGRDLYDHALASAAVAQLIARKLPGQDEHEAFLAGLLHDLGRVFLRESATHVRRDTRGKETTSPHALSLVDEAVHASLGALVAQSSGFSPELVQAIRYHPSPDKLPALPPAAPGAAGDGGRNLVHLLVIANRVAPAVLGKEAPPELAAAFAPLGIPCPEDLVPRAAAALEALRG